MAWSLKRNATGSLCRTATAELCACGSGYRVQFPNPFNENEIAKTYTLTQSGDVWVASDTIDSDIDIPQFDGLKDWLHTSIPYMIFRKTFDISIELGINEQTGLLGLVRVDISGEIQLGDTTIYSDGVSTTFESFTEGTTFLLSEPAWSVFLLTSIRRVDWLWPFNDEIIYPYTATIPDTPSANYRTYRIHMFTKLQEYGVLEETYDVGVTRSIDGEWRRFIQTFFSQGFWQTSVVTWNGSATLTSFFAWAQYDQEGEPQRHLVNFYTELLSET